MIKTSPAPRENRGEISSDLPEVLLCSWGVYLAWFKAHTIGWALVSMECLLQEERGRIQAIFSFSLLKRILATWDGLSSSQALKWWELKRLILRDSCLDVRAATTVPVTWRKWQFPVIHLPPMNNCSGDNKVNTGLSITCLIITRFF